MMLALMYGMIPSAKIEKRSSAPPENRLTSPTMLLRAAAKNWASAWPSMPGEPLAAEPRGGEGKGEPVEGERTGREEQALAELRDARRVCESLKHGPPPRSRRPRRSARAHAR